MEKCNNCIYDCYNDYQDFIRHTWNELYEIEDCSFIDKYAYGLTAYTIAVWKYQERRAA